MTSLLIEEYREPPDCPYTWGDGYVPCTYHDLPVHTCFIQAGHSHPCLCLCGDAPVPYLPRWQWSGHLERS